MITAILMLVLLVSLTPFMIHPQAILAAQRPIAASKPAPRPDELGPAA